MSQNHAQTKKSTPESAFLANLEHQNPKFISSPQILFSLLRHCVAMSYLREQDTVRKNKNSWNFGQRYYWKWPWILSLYFRNYKIASKKFLKVFWSDFAISKIWNFCWEFTVIPLKNASENFCFFHDCSRLF